MGHAILPASRSESGALRQQVGVTGVAGTKSFRRRRSWGNRTAATVAIVAPWHQPRRAMPTRGPEGHHVRARCWPVRAAPEEHRRTVAVGRNPSPRGVRCSHQRRRRANRRGGTRRIEEEGEVDHVEEAQNPISPAPERPGSSRGKAAAGRRHGGFGEVPARDKTRRERGSGSGQGLDLSRVGPGGPDWSGWTSWAQPIVWSFSYLFH
jgi:hypothetical protein